MKKIVAGLLGAFIVAGSANADVIGAAPVDGLATFKDTSTGLTWLRMDDFFNADATLGTSGYAMIAAAEKAGFTFATETEVRSLVGTLPLDSGQWQGYANVMGSTMQTAIWGMYNDGNGAPYGHASSYVWDTAWFFENNAIDPSGVPNNGDPGALGMGIWAYKNVPAVPEPETVAMMGAGLALIGVLSRRRKAE